MAVKIGPASLSVNRGSAPAERLQEKKEKRKAQKRKALDTRTAIEVERKPGMMMP